MGCDMETRGMGYVIWEWLLRARDMGINIGNGV